MPVVLEIGVMGGGSLEMWKAYFGEGCRIIGVDIHPEFKQHESMGVEIFIGSQDDPAVIAQILEKYPSIDIVIDDGSHNYEHMIASFNLLYSKISPNGVYLVEDTHTNYWPDWGLGGGLKKEGTFIEFSKNKIDEISAYYTGGAVPVSDFTVSTDSISFYDSVIVYEKRPQGARQAPITRGMLFPE
jgi:cephalosporin hydroxylase